MEPNRSIKNRLFQTLGNRSPKQAFLLEEGQALLAPILKPKKSQEGLTPTNAKALPMYKSGKLLLNPLPATEVVKKKPKEVMEEKLSKEAKSIVEEGKNRLRTNLKPHDIFQLYESFPEMLEDFFYLNRASHPYDYQIVTYAQRNPLQYMTISSQGLTLYHDKEAEFLTREQWLTDEKRYYQLQRIYFFKQYKLSKNFRIWKNKMRRHYMREMSSILSQHLFLTIKYPRNCLLAVRQHTNALKDSLSFFPYDTMEKLAEKEFEDLMMDYRQKVLLKAIRQITNQITQSLEAAVAEEINKFKSENNIKIDGVNEKQGSKEGYIYSQEAILRKQYKRVYKLIKLADSMLQEAKIEMVMKCLQQLIDRIRELQNQDKEPWVTCVATIQENGTINWQPDCPSLVGLFMRAINSHINAISDHNEKIIHRESFTKYRLADCGELKAEENRGSFKLMIEESPLYAGLIKQIQGILVCEFQQTSKEELLLQKFVDIYLRHKALASMGTIFRDNNGVELCNYVEEWKRDEKEMHQLSEDKKGRLILYNYADLRRKIINVPRQTLNCFLSLLPEETLTRCRDLIGESRTLFDLISVYPTEIVSFAKFNKAVKQASERLEDIRSSGSEICLLIDLMSKNKLGNLQLYNTKKIEALNSINVLKNKVDESEAKENQSLSKFKKDNEAEVAKIKTLIKDLASRFNTIEFNQTKVTAKEMKDILAKIREILPAINALEAQSRKIQEIEVELNLVQTDFQEVHQLYQNAKIVHDIWSCRDDWKSMLVNLYHRHYCDVDCAELKQSWEEFSNKINALAKLLPENEILKNLMQELGEVEVLIDTIIALRSPNLEEKAWREISEYLAYQLGLENDAELPFSNVRNPLYTVRWLLEINIPVYKEKIEFIVRKSQKERELGVHLSEYKSYIANMAFDLISKKREVYIFGDNVEIQEKIHLFLAQLYSMLDNQYSQSIKIQAENLIRHYQYVEEIIKAVFEFGNIWNKYESFFDGNSNSLKMLTKQSKQFFSWQAQWKKIIKNITTDAILFYKKVCDETTGINCSRSMMKQIAKINVTIDQVKKGLDEYLEKKRAIFPRYFFIPDERLLKMLSTVDCKEPITQSFVPVLYKNIQKILYKEDTKDTLLGIVSKQGEDFPLKNVSFKLQSEMEQIFKQTEEQIKKRLGYLIKTVFAKYIEEEITRQSMILDNNTQVVLAIDAIAWVRLAEETYLCNQPIGDFYDWIEIQQSQIKELKTLLDNSPRADHIQYKLMQLMSQSIYQREKTEYLLQHNITTAECYDWERIPRLCMSSNNSEVYLKQLSNRLNYCYEFLSNKSVCFIMAESEKAWINIAQAITNKQVVCLDSYSHNQMETIKDLGYVIGQEVETVHISENINFKNIQRFISGALFIGSWVCMNLPASEQVLSFLAHQINHIRKLILDPNLEKSKAQFVNSNVSFFLTLPSHNCALDKISPSLLHRNITLSKPNNSKVFGIISECLCNIPELGVKTINICELMNETFKQSFVKVFNKEACNEILQKAISILPNYEWLKQLKCKEYFQFIVCDALDGFIVPLLRKDDVRIYENLKNCIIPDYEKLKLRHPALKVQTNPTITSFLEKSKLPFLKKTEFMEEFELFERAVCSNNLGVILYGEPLSGKSTLINLVSKKIQEQSQIKIKQHRIYHRAYNREQIFSSEKASTIFTEIMNDSSSINWIVFDGTLSLEYLEIFGSEADRYLIPQIGTFTANRNKFKFICETYDVSTLSPSVIGNHSLVYLADALSTDTIIRKFFVQLQCKRYLINLQPETIEWLIAGFINILAKLENKSILKSKQINFIYPLSPWEITHRCCKVIEAIFIMNWESMREKEKNMKKFVDKFVAWCTYWSLLGVVFIEDEQKLEKFINQIYKTETNFPEELSNSIIYPGCGLEVQQINGLRTQSSLEIPEKGIITNLLRSDLISDVDHQKGNKFYEQIVISQPHVIRVNYLQSNKYNYISQLSYLTDTPVFLIGSPNSGKKSIVELFAKNMRNKSQYYSIRYKNRQYLSAQIERPFRKLIALEGIIMKSVSASKKLIISIEDVSLNSEHKQTSELLRMIFNERGYYNKQAQWMRFSNCCFNLIVSKFINNTDNLRLLSKMTLFQTSSAMVDKLQAIFSPYLKNWSAFNGLSGDVERIFNSENGDTLLDATLSVYKLMEQLHKAETERGSLERFLLKPRIGDVTKVLTYICKTPEANHYNLTYYYELWTHEIVRVFGDRMSTARQKEQLFKQIKKESLVKFKQNFTLNYNTMFNFTSLGIENENCYIRIEDPSFLHTYISNLLEADQINLPLKFLFDELLQHLIKIYRIITVEGAHLLLLSHNPSTAKYLIELACQVGQNDFYELSHRLISVEKHIEPTLYYKDNVCLTEDVDNLTEDAIYQIACLINYNYYQFGLKGEIREKVKLNLNKKEKVEVEKKESKLFSKTKTEQVKIEQKQEDIETLMAEQFMNFAHFIFQARPTSDKLKTFISKQNDIVGQLQFNWIDIPQESIIKVAKQILNFDQETSELMLQGHSNDKLIEKVRIIFESNPIEDRYFNDILIISELVKTESARLSAPLLQRQKDIRQAKEIYIKVTNQINEKEEKMKCLQEEIEEINTQLQSKCRELEEVNNKISEWQMSINSEENNNAEGLSQLRVQREEIQIELKLIKQRKEQLEPEKKKILKNIKIANDYLEIFDNSLDSFDRKVEEVEERIMLLQDKLVIVWSLATHLIKHPVHVWIQKANQWIDAISSKIPTLLCQQELLSLVEEVCPYAVSRPELFCTSLRIKLDVLILLLANYEETSFYGKIIKIHDPKGILPFVLEYLSTEDNMNYSLLKSFPLANREARAQIQTLCKMKNGLIVIESEKDIEQLQFNLVEKKMSSYLNKIIVISGSTESAHLTLECDEDQLLLSVENLMLKEMNPGLFQEKIMFNHELIKEQKKKEENEELFYRASSSINIETQTYTEELNKYKNVLAVIEDNLKNLIIQCKTKRYLEMPEFEMFDFVYQAIRLIWAKNEINLKHLSFIYHQSIYLRNGAQYEQLSLQEKGRILQNTVNANLGDSSESLHTHLKFTKKWDNKVKLYIIKPNKRTVELLQCSKQYKLINLLATNNIIPHVNQNSALLKVLYNFIPCQHASMLNEVIEIQYNDTSERVVPLILMAEGRDLRQLEQSKIKMIEIELDLQAPKEMERESKFKWAENLKKYLLNLTQNKQHTALVVSFIEKCTDYAKGQQQLAKLLSDILPQLQANTISNLLNLSSEDIAPYLYNRTTISQQKQRRGTEVTKNCQEIGSIKEELPFIFNTAEFIPSKDPMAAQLVLQCLQFNRRLKQVKDRLKQSQFEWEEIERVIPTNRTIQCLNNEHQTLRKNLIRLHLLANSNLTSNAKAASHKTFSSGNIHFQNIIKLPHSMLTAKIINLIRCKAAKKFKSKLANIYINWKICTPNFSFEENNSLAELSTIVEGKLFNGKLLQSSWSSNLESLKSIELVAFAIESLHEPKVNPQSLYIPIKNQDRILGHLEIPKNELSSDYIIGLESAEIRIEQSD